MKVRYNIGRIPFYYIPLSTPFNPEDLPDKLEFTLTQDDCGIIKQFPNEQVQDYLNLSYEKGSHISGLMDDNGIGKLYADDFIRYIHESEQDINGKKVLEIGCGTGYLLYRLKKMGADVLGVEPGTHGLDGAKKYGVPILNDFFNPDKITEKYDIVIFYGVLEHILNTEKFLQDIKSVLKKEGKIFLSVPDCEPYIQAGDISLLIHEHWNYFTKNTLEIFTSNNGLTGNVVRSGFAGALYATLMLGKYENYVNLSQRDFLSDYINKIEIQKEKIHKFIENAISNQTLGIYVPGRMINLLSICYAEVPDQIRFFDDNINLYNTYFPGINITIENFEDFVNNPVDVMLISSFTFGAKIKDKISNSGIRCKIILLEELFM